MINNAQRGSVTNVVKFFLQNPANKREIICDDKLKTIFDGKDRVGFLEIAKLLAPHFVKTPWPNFLWLVLTFRLLVVDNFPFDLSWSALLELDGYYYKKVCKKRKQSLSALHFDALGCWENLSWWMSLHFHAPDSSCSKRCSNGGTFSDIEYRSLFHF